MGLDIQAKVVYSSLVHGLSGRDKLRGIQSILSPSFFKLETDYGRFLCADQSGPLQFLPHWENQVKTIVKEVKGGLFVDVGANIGFYSILAAKRGNRVIAFEPNPRAFKCLVYNIRDNGLTNKITAHNKACWSERTTLRLDFGSESDLSKIGNHGATVEGVPLDETLDGQTPELVKIDVEGSEAKVMEGMRETLKFKPWLCFEAWDCSHLSQCRRILEPSGYKVTRLDAMNYIGSPRSRLLTT